MFSWAFELIKQFFSLTKIFFFILVSPYHQMPRQEYAPGCSGNAKIIGREE